MCSSVPLPIDVVSAPSGRQNRLDPQYWQKPRAGWLVKRFDQWLPVQANAAVIHVNWFEAEAYCKWAKRRLPSEAEWEFAAATAPGNLSQKRRYPWGDAPPTPEHANLHGVASGTVDVQAFAADPALGLLVLP